MKWMDRKQLELKKAISAGVAEGIIKAQKATTRPEMSVIDHANAVWEYCHKRSSCNGCLFAIESNTVECALEDPPTMWKLYKVR